MVFFATPSGTPGLSGRPKVATPEPAFIKSESEHVHGNSLQISK